MDENYFMKQRKNDCLFLIKKGNNDFIFGAPFTQHYYISVSKVLDKYRMNFEPAALPELIKKPTSTGTIVAIILSVLVFIGVIVAVIVYRRRKQRLMGYRQVTGQTV